MSCCPESRVFHHCLFLFRFLITLVVPPLCNTRLRRHLRCVPAALPGHLLTECNANQRKNLNKALLATTIAFWNFQIDTKPLRSHYFYIKKNQNCCFQLRIATLAFYQPLNPYYHHHHHYHHHFYQCIVTDRPLIGINHFYSQLEDFQLCFFL